MKNNYLTFISSSVLALGTALALTPSASAFTLNFDASSQSTNTPPTGSSATADFDFFDNTSGGVDLKLTITNTTGQSTFGQGATASTLVGIGFDLDNSITSGVFNSLDSNFNKLLTGNLNGVTITADSSDEEISNGSADISGNVGQGNSNTFEIGLIPDNRNSIGGGNANQGLTAGNSTMVQFSFATDPNSGISTAAELEDSFLDLFSSNDFSFGARFQQVNTPTGSDKLIGGDITPDDPQNPPEPQDPVDVPEPATLLGLGLFTLTAAKFTRKKK